MEEKNNYPIHTCVRADTIFPYALREIPRPPAILYYRGVIANPRPRIAIVGTRKASDTGKKLAQRIAYECAAQGWCVVSGLAFGIDAAAHQGALEAERITWAVLAHGLDTVQPKQHQPLARKILDHEGCLLSEYDKGTPALAHQFLERNRIIAGVSAAVIVIEAPRASGALVTARHAAQQKKPVLVFPGTATSPLYEGSHELIRSGARLVRSMQDIGDDLARQSLLQSANNGQPQKLSDAQQTIFEYISHKEKSVSFDEILEHAHLPYTATMEAITHLIATHHIEEDGLQTYHAILPKISR